MQGLEKYLIQEKGFCNIEKNGEATGFRLEIMLPFYRALPLSNITKIKLKIDGKEVDERDITFELRGVSYKLDQFSGLHHDDNWWGFVENAVLIVDRKGGLTTDSYSPARSTFLSGIMSKIFRRLRPGEHRIELYMRYRWPIGLPEEGGGLRRMHDDNFSSKILKIQ